MESELTRQELMMPYARAQNGFASKAGTIQSAMANYSILNKSVCGVKKDRIWMCYPEELDNSSCSNLELQKNSLGFKWRMGLFYRPPVGRITYSQVWRLNRASNSLLQKDTPFKDL